jgi:hypothetical protein
MHKRRVLEVNKKEEVIVNEVQSNIYKYYLKAYVISKIVTVT